MKGGGYESDNEDDGRQSERCGNVPFLGSSVVSLCRCLYYVKGSRSPFYLIYIWCTEVREEEGYARHVCGLCAVRAMNGFSGQTCILLFRCTPLIVRLFPSARLPSPLFNQLWEIIIQLLAVQQFSETGLGRVALGVYTFVIFLNACTPLVLMAALPRRLQGDHSHTGKVTQRILLFDAACDCEWR